MMHFLYASDEGFSAVLKASLHSLFESHPDRKLTAHIIGQSLSETTISDIERMAQTFGQQVDFIDMPDFEVLLGRPIDPKKYTLSAFSRLFVDALVDSEIDRIIYLDCDTVVVSDLSTLWEFDMGEATIGAVDDCRNWRYLRHLGLPRDATYINSGVLLMDLRKYADGRWRERFSEGMLRYDGLLEFPDNDLICMLMQDDLVILPPEFNMISPVRACDYAEVRKLRRPSGYYSEAMYLQAKKRPAIIHYTTYFGVRGRPWFEGYDLEDGAPFRAHFDQTGGVLRPPKDISAVKGLAIRAMNGPLRPVALWALGVAHSRVKPALARRAMRRIRAVESRSLSGATI